MSQEHGRNQALLDDDLNDRCGESISFSNSPTSDVDTALTIHSVYEEIETTEGDGDILAEYFFVKTKDDKEFVLSRRVLADESNYFRAMFSHDFLESKDTVILLPGIDGPSFSQAINLIPAIHSKVLPKMCLSNAVQILPVASYLCMDNLLITLSKIILSQATPKTILEVFRKCAQYHHPLASVLWKKIIQEFQVFYETKNYLKMNEDELINALEDENLNLSSKDELKAINHFVTSRHTMDRGRLSEIADRKHQKVTGDGTTSYPVLKNRVPSDVVLAIGGWSSYGATEVVEVFNTRREKWASCAEAGFSLDKPRAYHAMTLVDDSLFVCGGMNGREFFQDTSSYNMNTKTWSHLADMVDRRCYLGGVNLIDSQGSQSLFVGGGFNGMERLSSCEMYSVSDNTWQKTSSMTKKRSDFSLVRAGEHVFAIGGFDGSNIHSDLEFFDKGKEQWYSTRVRMRSERTGVNAVALTENTLIICGGYNGKKRLRTTEIFDKREGRCYNLNSMFTTRSNFGIVTFDDKVYVAGGFDGIRTTSHSEVYSIRADKWIKLPDLVMPKSALKLIHVDDVRHNRYLVNFDSPGINFT